MSTCKHCGEPFERTNPRRAYCSDRCRNLTSYGRQRQRGYQSPKNRYGCDPLPGRHQLTCERCGGSFTAHRKGTRYCSVRCQRRAYNERRIANGRLAAANEKSRNRRKAWMRANKHRYDVRLKDATVAPVDRDAIYARDGWRCQLCGRKVRRGADYNHPDAPTLDHIVPLAHGGSHEPANVHTAHRRCNVRKSTGGSGEQLALI